MELEITKQRETPLLERTRISAMVDFENKTPSRVQLRKDIAKKLKTDESLIIIRHIYQRYGQKTAKVIAHVYKDAKYMERLEGKVLIDKHNKEEKKEEPKAEKPAEEEKKEEPKAEEKVEEKKEEAPAKEEAKPAENAEEKKE